jgi:hypothetical protein
MGVFKDLGPVQRNGGLKMEKVCHANHILDSTCFTLIHMLVLKIDEVFTSDHVDMF